MRGRSREVFHVFAIERDDDIAGLQAGRLRRTFVVDARDQSPVRRAQSKAVGDRVVDVLDADAEPAPSDLMELTQLIDDRHHAVRRSRKTDADRSPRRREDGCVDADDVAIHVEQRAAGVPLVDGSVGLQVIVVGAAVDVAIASRHDPRRHRPAQSKRIADRHHGVADAHLAAVAEFHRLQRLVGFHLQYRDVDLAVLAQHFSFELAPVRQDDRDLVGTLDHVIVGDHDTSGIDHEARTERR